MNAKDWGEVKKFILEACAKTGCDVGSAKKQVEEVEKNLNES